MRGVPGPEDVDLAVVLELGTFMGEPALGENALLVGLYARMRPTKSEGQVMNVGRAT